MKKTIGIIGGSGFIGKNLTDFFLEINYDIIVVSRTYSDLEKLSKIKWIQADISNTTQIINGLKNCQNIIWLASSLIPSISNESLKDDYNLNVSPIIDFFEKSNQLQELQKFIFLRSRSWVTTTALVPASHCVRSISNTARACAGSRPAVGSSSSRHFAP